MLDIRFESFANYINEWKHIYVKGYPLAIYLLVFSFEDSLS